MRFTYSSAIQRDKGGWWENYQLSSLNILYPTVGEGVSRPGNRSNSEVSAVVKSGGRHHTQMLQKLTKGDF